MHRYAAMSDEVREELAIVHHRRKANWLGAASIVGISTLAVVFITFPPPPSGPPEAIGGGPSDEAAGEVVCHTEDGAPYVAYECAIAEPAPTE